MQKTGLAPIYRADCRILILGSLPGDASLSAGEYYAHPRNAFWPIMSELLQIDLMQRPFPERYQQLQNHGIALWDVIASAKRQGSLDSAIQDAASNPLATWCQTLPQLQLVAFNGQTAAKCGSKLLPEYLQQAVLPSSSPAHTLKQQEKIRLWLEQLRPYL